MICSNSSVEPHYSGNSTGLPQVRTLNLNHTQRKIGVPLNHASSLSKNFHLSSQKLYLELSVLASPDARNL